PGAALWLPFKPGGYFYFDLLVIIALFPALRLVMGLRRHGCAKCHGQPLQRRRYSHHAVIWRTDRPRLGDGLPFTRFRGRITTRGSASAYFTRFFKRWHSCQLAISLFKIKCIPDPGSAESGSQSHVLGDLFTLSTSTRLISGHSHGSKCIAGTIVKGRIRRQ